MLRCKDVAELVGTDALAHAPLRQRLAVWMHLAMCRHCRAYVRSLARDRARHGEPDAAEGTWSR
jgi:hypothetical protein